MQCTYRKGNEGVRKQKNEFANLIPKTSLFA